MKALLEHADHEVCRLSSVPHVVARGAHPADLGSAAAQISDLCQRLGRLRRTREIHSILITSTVPREGKTVVAVNLAVSLVKQWPRVLLVDGDLRQAGVASTLGLSHLLPGLAEGLEHDWDLSGAIRLVEPLQIHWLPAGCPSGEPGKVLHDSCLRTRLEELSQGFDWVVVDSPSMLSAETRFLTDATDVVVMVVKTGLVPREQVRESIADLEGAFLAGLVFHEEDKIRPDTKCSAPSFAFGTI